MERNMREWMMAGRMALQFFTIFPAAKTVEWTERRAARTIVWLPLLGLGMASVLFLFLSFFTSMSVSAAAAVLLFLLAGTALTGGLHLDGWMDVSDAYFSRREREKKLDILNDPHIGAFAVLSLLFLLGIRWAAVYELLLREQIDLWLLAFIATMPRLTGGWLLLTEPSAKEKGLAAYFQKGATSRLKKGYVLLSASFIVFFFILAENKWTVCALFLGVLTWYAFCRLFAKRQFGGVTGDTTGAAIEGGETWLWTISLLLHAFVMV
jgi:adenosylcobinamide-GDP ribazoletransferase